MLAPEEKQCCAERSLGQVINFSLEGLFLSKNANDKNASSGTSQLMAQMVIS
jgi:hypothetical protein